MYKSFDTNSLSNFFGPLKKEKKINSARIPKEEHPGGSTSLLDMYFHGVVSASGNAFLSSRSTFNTTPNPTPTFISNLQSDGTFSYYGTDTKLLSQNK